MTYATRAKRFTADQQRRRDLVNTGCEKSERSEKRGEPAPVDVMTPERTAILRAHKPAILTLLAEEEATLRCAADDVEGAAFYRVKRCPSCRFERNEEIVVCPRCHPAAHLPSDCLAKTMCTVLGPCGRRPCAVGAVPMVAATSPTPATRSTSA
jgi:ssDNA-binding Zn-finger/Zn-ribbon topoisomerase 1